METPNPLTWATATAASGAAFLGMYVADLFTREVHWRQDNVWYQSKNAFFRAIAREGRVHHEDPNSYLKNNYLGRVGETLPLTLPLWGISTAVVLSGAVGHLTEMALSPFGVSPGSIGPVVDAALGTFMGAGTLGVMHATWAHQSAHNPKPNLLMRVLQAAHLSVRREAHMAHHQSLFEDDYTSVNGWSRQSQEQIQARLRREFEKTGLIPGVWIQAPEKIPEDIRKKLIADYEKNKDSIPNDLWAYAPRAYPKRVPKDLKGPLKFVQQKWRADFITKRHREWSDAIEKLGYDEANRHFKEEQQKYEWIYGPVPQDLDPQI